jgi:tripartite-type tricarboxylate transporter receptor subunit TctC
MRRRALLALTPLPALARAEAAWPDRPLRIVVPSPSGGPPDLLLRIILPGLAARLGQPVVIENRAGGGGLVGTAYVARLPADGYTWLCTTASHVNIPPFNENVSYDPVRDFAHVTLIAQNFGQALIVRPDLPAADLPGLIALARAEPGRLTYVNAGNGTASHIPAEMLKTATGTDLLSVPYRGVAEGMTDLLGGRVDLFFVGTQIAREHVEAGRVRALAITGPRRWPGLPTVPTMAEAGLPGFEVVNWFGLWLPAGAPGAIIARMQTAVAAAVAEAEIRAQFERQGLEGIALPPEAFARFVAEQSAIAQAIGRRIGGK